MVALKRLVAAGATAAAALTCVILDRAAAGESAIPSYLFFSGTDLWRFGAFLYGGTLWSPNGLDANGFTGPT